MIARLQRRLVFGLLALSITWFLVCWRTERPLLAIVGVPVIMLAYAAFLAAELLMVLIVSARDPKEAPTKRELIDAWWGEVKVAPQIFYWRQPFRWAAEPDSLPPAMVTGARGVLLVHGFMCNRAFWNPWMKQLRQAGIGFLAIDLEPPFGSIGGHAAAIDQAVRRLTAATGVAPLVVAHSMGGLAVRHWLAESQIPDRVHGVITIGTPHGGTLLARFSHVKPGTEMAIRSAWLGELRQRSDAYRNSLVTSFYGNADNVVFPASITRLYGADNRLIRATGHVQLAFHKKVFAEALQRLK